jgi:hypothetical protein
MSFLLAKSDRLDSMKPAARRFSWSSGMPSYARSSAPALIVSRNPEFPPVRTYRSPLEFGGTIFRSTSSNALSEIDGMGRKPGFGREGGITKEK